VHKKSEIEKLAKDGRMNSMFVNCLCIPTARLVPKPPVTRSQLHIPEAKDVTKRLYETGIGHDK